MIAELKTAEVLKKIVLANRALKGQKRNLKKE